MLSDHFASVVTAVILQDILYFQN